MNMELSIIKIGGNIIDDEVKLRAFLDAFAAVPGKKILVHGGGKLATKVAEGLGIRQRLVDGRRITDGETLKVVTMVYAGTINKNIVAQLQARGCDAIGLTGADGNSIRAHKRVHPEIDYGFVGDVDAVDAAFITGLLMLEKTLVFSPITHDGNGLLLNTNADTIAQELARGLGRSFDVSLVSHSKRAGCCGTPGTTAPLSGGSAGQNTRS
jgi:acetylglutamate kinase